MQHFMSVFLFANAVNVETQHFVSPPAQIKKTFNQINQRFRQITNGATRPQTGATELQRAIAWVVCALGVPTFV